MVDTLKVWIKEDLSRIYPLQIEKEQIDGALNTLTKQQKYIIECKYFENMIWRDIEKNLNDKFRQMDFILNDNNNILKYTVKTGYIVIKGMWDICLKNNWI